MPGSPSRDELRASNDSLRSQVESMLATVERQQQDLASAQARLASTSAQGRSADELVRATVNAAGTLTRVEIAPEAFKRSTPESLGRAVESAVANAQQAARQLAAELMAPVLAETADFPDLSDLVPGAPSLRGLLPPLPTSPVREPEAATHDEDGWGGSIMREAR